MPKRNSKSTMGKTVVIKMCKAHRILVLTIFVLLFLFMLAAMILVILSEEHGIVTSHLIIAVPIILFLPSPLYYATWKITFDTDGIQKHIFGINGKKRPWTQVKEVRSAWLISERSNGISIIFKDRKAIHFRMDCENAEAAKRLILSHCSITEHRGMI